MAKKRRDWIFWVLLGVGVASTLFFVVTATNLIYKNDDFTLKVMFDSGVEGDSGYLTIKRNPTTPSTADWCTFGNNSSLQYVSTSFVREKIFVDMPSNIEPGVYKFDVEAVYLSGYEETKTVSFRII